MDINHILSDFRKSGLRLTPVRKEITSIFCHSSGPLTAGDILNRVSANKTTVYREIDTLVKNNYLSEVDFGDGTKRYELTSLGHHHHLICLNCKSVTAVKLSDDLLEEERRLSVREKFQITKHNLEFFGLCRSCQS